MINELNFVDSLAQALGASATNFMASDIIENEKEYVVTSNIPGISKENIKLNFDNNKLTISVNKDEEKKEYMMSELFRGNYSRSFYLKDADGDNIHAKYLSGVLTITVGKKEKNLNKTVISID